MKWVHVAGCLITRRNLQYHPAGLRGKECAGLLTACAPPSLRLQTTRNERRILLYITVLSASEGLGQLANLVLVISFARVYGASNATGQRADACIGLLQFVTPCPDPSSRIDGDTAASNSRNNRAGIYHRRAEPDSHGGGADIASSRAAGRAISAVGGAKALSTCRSLFWFVGIGHALRPGHDPRVERSD